MNNPPLPPVPSLDEITDQPEAHFLVGRDGWSDQVVIENPENSEDFYPALVIHADGLEEKPEIRLLDLRANAFTEARETALNEGVLFALERSRG